MCILCALYTASEQATLFSAKSTRRQEGERIDTVYYLIESGKRYRSVKEIAAFLGVDAVAGEDTAGIIKDEKKRQKEKKDEVASNVDDSQGQKEIRVSIRTNSEVSTTHAIVPTSLLERLNDNHSATPLKSPPDRHRCKFPSCHRYKQ